MDIVSTEHERARKMTLLSSSSSKLCKSCTCIIDSKERDRWERDENDESPHLDSTLTHLSNSNTRARLLCYALYVEQPPKALDEQK